MKKLPICALLCGAGFVIAGTVLLAQLTPQPRPSALFLPLVWDAVMVAISVGIILRCDCVRRVGFVWGIFCVLASLAIGAAAFDWLLPQLSDPMGPPRLVFMIVTVGFGVVFSIWQVFARNSAAVRDFAESEHHDSHLTHANHS